MALRMRHQLGSAVRELRYEPVTFRVRAFLGGEPVVDSMRAVLVWEPRRLVPVYAVPAGDVRLEQSETARAPEPFRPEALPPVMGPEQFSLHTTPGRVVDLVHDGTRRLDGAGFLPADPDLHGLVVLDFGAFDSWLAEEQPLVAHPHDPFKRIDVLDSSRQVEVSLDGTVLGSTSHGRVLLETFLPPRWYLPPEDVRMDLLVPSEHRTACAYKGHAAYLSTADGREAGRDIGWHYPAPLDDALRVRDRVCFWSERTDLVLDGTPVRRPVTPWSRPEEQAATDVASLEFG